MHDGTEVYIEVTRPADDAGRPLDGQWPVILEASPYHGTLADREGVHNWAGLPGTRVDLTLSYLDSAGEPGA